MNKLIFTLLMGLLVFPLNASLDQEFPVLYKGRFRSAEAYARLWLHNLYHAPTLKKTDFGHFQATDSSSLSFLMSLAVLGHVPYQNAPLFWIESAESKRLAGLTLSNNRFSYQELAQALYHNQDISQAIIQRLATYHFLKAYLESPYRTQRLELSSLMPGFWIQWRGDDLVIASVPPISPWPFLKAGQLLAPSIRTQAHERVKRDKRLADEWTNLWIAIKEFEQLQGPVSPMELRFQKRFAYLQTQALPPKEIEYILDQEFPLMQRLQNAGSLFQVLPGRYQKGEWFPLQALRLQAYHPHSHALKPIGNFTLFSDSHFERLREAYLSWEESLTQLSGDTLYPEKQHHLFLLLQQAYDPLAGHIYQEAHGKQLRHPTLAQLKIETLYVGYPWIPLLIFFYGTGAFILMLSYRFSWPFGGLLAKGIICLALLCHTGLLAMRCYILERPPVSNMFETVIYVPWVATCMSLLIPSFRRHPLVLFSACLTSIALLLILEITHLNQSLEQVQAVLDSQFWLMIHVLLVVGSYGIFILGAVLGHFYFALFFAHRMETPTMTLLSQLILQTMYAGTLFLVSGTILGGIWAAESWGRFWDWDPKESWAFISSCLYLIWIHAYRFHRIASFGLAFGSVSGLLAISFTWYGVNYILGTGLHSYGFGVGGEKFYYAFLGAELLLLTLALGFYFRLHSPLFKKSNF